MWSVAAALEAQRQLVSFSYSTLTTVSSVSSMRWPFTSSRRPSSLSWMCFTPALTEMSTFESRSCFALLRSKGEWLYYDPMSHYTFTGVIGAYPVLPLLRVFRARGMRALLVHPDRPPRIAQAWRFYTCVEAVKRVLGLQEPWVLTPWQLYRRLARRRAVRVTRRIP